MYLFEKTKQKYIYVTKKNFSINKNMYTAKNKLLILDFN